LLLYLGKTHFIEPNRAVAEWNRGNLDALVASTEKATSLMPQLRDAALSRLKSNERKEEQGKVYVLIARVKRRTDPFCFPQSFVTKDLGCPLYRLFEMRSPFFGARDKYPLIRLQRVERSVSPGGSAQTQCKSSGRITTALRWKGCRSRTLRNAVSNTSIRATNSRSPRHSARFSVKKTSGPASQAQSYLVNNHLFLSSFFASDAVLGAAYFLLAILAPAASGPAFLLIEFRNALDPSPAFDPHTPVQISRRLRPSL